MSWVARGAAAAVVTAGGWMGAELGGVRPGDVVAVWGCGAVGQLAARAAMLLGAARVIAIDRFDHRLQMTERHIGAETLYYEQTDIDAELRERSGGRGPDVCIEAVGLEAHSPGPQFAYDTVKLQLRLESDRPAAVREAIQTCRKGGSVFVLMLLERMARSELVTEHLATHVMPLEQGPQGYALFQQKLDGCVRTVFRP